MKELALSFQKQKNCCNRTHGTHCYSLYSIITAYCHCSSVQLEDAAGNSVYEGEREESPLDCSAMELLQLFQRLIVSIIYSHTLPYKEEGQCMHVH